MAVKETYLEYLLRNPNQSDESIQSNFEFRLMMDKARHDEKERLKKGEIKLLDKDRILSTTIASIRP